MTIVVLDQHGNLYADSYQGGRGINSFPVRKIKELRFGETRFWATGAGSIQVMDEVYSAVERFGVDGVTVKQHWKGTDVVLVQRSATSGGEQFFYLTEAGFVRPRGAQLPGALFAAGVTSYFAAYMAEWDGVETALEKTATHCEHAAFPLWMATSDGGLFFRTKPGEGWQDVSLIDDCYARDQTWHAGYFERKLKTDEDLI